MSLLDKMNKAMENKEEPIQDDEQPKKKQTRTPRAKKVVVPEHIKNLFNNIDKSINSAWGVQESGKVKWDSKYNQWVSFKLWFEELSK